MRFSRSPPSNPFAHAQSQGGSAIFPPQDGSAAQLGRDLAEMMEIQKRANVVQRWGSTVLMPVTNGAALPTGFQQLINIGPFPEPRALAFEEYFLAQDGSSPGELSAGQNLSLNTLFAVTIGIGQSTVTHFFNHMPSVLFAQSLTVAVARNDNSVIGYQYSLWAVPHVPRSFPVALTSAVYTFTAATASIVIGGPPNFATHVQLAYDASDAIDEFIMMGIPVYQSNLNLTGAAPPTGNARLLMTQRFGATPASGVWLDSPVYPIPRPVAGTIVLTRSTTVAQLDVTVNWLRC